jgi:peptide deformylase
MLLKLYQTGQPVLRKKAKLLTKQQLASRETQKVIDFMVATLRDAPGVGLAAPQVGELLQIIIIEDKAKYHATVPKMLLHEQQRTVVPLQILVNPQFEIINPIETLFFEGCLSVDNYLAVVPRASSVKVKAWDRDGKAISFLAHGWHARILQHEMDHLRGNLYIDIMKKTSFMSIKNFSMLWRTANGSKIKKAFADQ